MTLDQSWATSGIILGGTRNISVFYALILKIPYPFQNRTLFIFDGVFYTFPFTFFLVINGKGIPVRIFLN